jgi:hypothetical protein
MFFSHRERAFIRENPDIKVSVPYEQLIATTHLVKWFF